MIFDPYDGHDVDLDLSTRAAEILEEEPTYKRPIFGAKDVSNEEITVKALIRSMDAGSVIGKAGAAINELQLQSGARLRMSRTNQCFPGTSDRLLLISGTVGAFLTSVHLLLQRIRTYDRESVDDDPITFRMVVPNRVCGGLIGEKGGTIQAIAEDSGAKVTVSSHRDMVPGLHERVVSCTGQVNEILRALALISSILLEDVNYIETDFSLTYDGIVNLPLYASLGPGARSTPASLPSGISSVEESVSCADEPNAQEKSATIMVSDQYVGAVLGKGGRNLHEIMKLSNTRITVSRREEMSASTRERTIRITGSPEGCAFAQWLMDQQITALMQSTH